MPLNTSYLSSNRGVAKILEIIVGFIISSLICVNWYAGHNCLSDNRLAFTAYLNVFVVLLNVAIFVANFLNFGLLKIERIYAMLCALLFLIAAVLVVWFIVQRDMHRVFLIVATILILFESLFFILDLKIIQGKISNE